MKQIKVLVSFEDNEMIFPNIELVENDYNHVEFIFDFDEDDGKKVFEYATMISESNYKYGLDYYLLNAVNDLLDRMEEIGDMTKFEV